MAVVKSVSVNLAVPKIPNKSYFATFIKDSETGLCCGDNLGENFHLILCSLKKLFVLSESINFHNSSLKMAK